MRAEAAVGFAGCIRKPVQTLWFGHDRHGTTTVTVTEIELIPDARSHHPWNA